jgi:hypothetical protein
VMGGTFFVLSLLSSLRCVAFDIDTWIPHFLFFLSSYKRQIRRMPAIGIAGWTESRLDGHGEWVCVGDIIVWFYYLFFSCVRLISVGCYGVGDITSHHHMRRCS